jgi:hypothetical protein
MKSLQICVLIFAALLVQHGAAQTNVTGVVVDTGGRPIAGVRCVPSGSRELGWPSSYITDEEGKFAVPLFPAMPTLGLQFDRQVSHAPVFLYHVRATDSPLRVVMTEGKLLRGRIVERVKGEAVPVTYALIELQMPQGDVWYQSRQMTDAKGEFQFRISEPPGKWPWMLSYAGVTLPVDYAQVTAETVMVLEVSVKMTPSAEPNGGANAASPRRSP